MQAAAPPASQAERRQHRCYAACQRSPEQGARQQGARQKGARQQVRDSDGPNSALHLQIYFKISLIGLQ